MRILFAHLYDAAYSMGGAEKVVLDLALGLRRLHGDEFACAVNAGEMAEAMRAAGVPVAEIFLSKAKTLTTLSRMTGICRSWRPDLIHSHHRYTTFLGDIFFKRSLPVLHTEHVLRQDKKILFRYGSLATAVHESVGKNLAGFYGVPQNKIRVIPNAVPPREPDSARMEELRCKYPRERGEMFAICIGRLEEQKGQKYLIEAVGLMTERVRSRLRVFLLGDGSYAPMLRRLAEEKGVSPQFVFVGHTPHIPEYLAMGDFLVLPSLWEGMPLSVLEAYGADKPVLATDIPGTRDVVSPGFTGELVPARDPQALARRLEAWLSAPEKLVNMGESAGQKWRNEYSFEVMVGRYRKLYVELTGKGR